MPFQTSPTDKFGQHFQLDMDAASLNNLPIAINFFTGEIVGRENLSEADNATLDAVIASHDPTKQPENVLEKEIDKLATIEDVKAFLKKHLAMRPLLAGFLDG